MKETDREKHRVVYNTGSTIKLDITLSHQIHVLIADFLPGGRSRVFLCNGRWGRERSVATTT